MPKKLPIGKADFKGIIEQDYTFVDKSLLIREVLDSSAEVLLIPRPRRFGKTLNMQMLEHFFRYQIRSNREEGAGRADVVMSPFEKRERGFVIELKAIGGDGDLDQALAEALAQIEEKHYAAGLEADGVKDIARLAIVLQGKTVKIKDG